MTYLWRRCERRLHELMADRALFGLETEEAEELEQLLQSHPGDARDSMDSVAARCELALGVDVQTPLPAGLEDRIRTAGMRMLESSRP